MVGIVQRSTVCLNEYGVSIWDTTVSKELDYHVRNCHFSANEIATSNTSRARGREPAFYLNDFPEQGQVAIPEYETLAFLSPAQGCSGAGPHGNPPLEPPLPGRTSHPVPVPAIVVWNPEVLDKGKNMWTSCRIRVTSCPNATASQLSIVHIGWSLVDIWPDSGGQAR
ncbi:hypothetical protein EDD15DRAFT_2196913 [Pisolithus albus]|nr:hypothetical protein EDD15DRAFT_2200406 [Pisolithus albus]KAI5992721.1 hypothetical protein EDD15DRAFT_2196913 [Pisolithus albus]